MSSDQINEFLTISVGVANYPNDGKTSKHIIECVDAAMYVAKRSGRNQSILYSRKDEMSYYITNQCEVEEMRDSITSAKNCYGILQLFLFSRQTGLGSISEGTKITKCKHFIRLKFNEMLL
jgi:predicted signal transduction protein with EAL and GGDEF domain